MKQKQNAKKYLESKKTLEIKKELIKKKLMSWKAELINEYKKCALKMNKLAANLVKKKVKHQHTQKEIIFMRNHHT